MIIILMRIYSALKKHKEPIFISLQLALFHFKLVYSLPQKVLN